LNWTRQPLKTRAAAAGGVPGADEGIRAGARRFGCEDNQVADEMDIWFLGEAAEKQTLVQRRLTEYEYC